MATELGGVVEETITLRIQAGGEDGSPRTVRAVGGEDAQDVWGYRIAVGAVGLALVFFLIGTAVIVAVGKEVPSQLWTTGSAISGALLGILAPSPKTAAPAKTVGDAVKSVFTDLWNNRAVLILLVIFGLAVWRNLEKESTEWLALAAASGGALIGLLAPSPSKKG